VVSVSFPASVLYAMSSIMRLWASMRATALICASAGSGTVTFAGSGMSVPSVPVSITRTEGRS
jgi:hypothetical protein